jgi:hypothetical protein
VAAVAGEHADQPALPEEARAQVRAEELAPTLPVEASPGQALQIRFRAAPPDELVGAFEQLKALIQDHPGETTVVLRLPAGQNREQRMQLRTGVAYDAELLAALRRRIGDQLLDLTLTEGPASPASPAS